MAPVIKTELLLIEQLADNVRRLRALSCWSQEYLANRAGLHPTEVSRIERGMRHPRAVTLVRLAQALSCTVDDLLAPVVV